MNDLVSVIMPVYNCEKYLNQSIKSILNQSYKNIEFLIINDGSKDKSIDIINNYAKEDYRIKLINNKENKGIIYCLNKGIDEARGKYIARMDADDIAILDRIEKQIKFMEKDNELVMCGSSAMVLLDKNKFVKKNLIMIKGYEKIKAATIFNCSFIHPSIIIKKDIIDKYDLKYKEEYKNAEDFGLWCEIIPQFKVDNTEKPLIKYRIVKNSITRESNRNLDDRKKIFKKIYKKYLKCFDIHLSEREANIHFEIAMIQNLNNTEFTLDEKKDYLVYLCNKINNRYVFETCAYQYLKCCIYQGSYQDFKDSKFKNNASILKFIKVYFMEKVKLIIKNKYK